MSATQDWSVFDRPELAPALGPRSGDQTEALIALDGMHCAACAARAERLLAERAAGVHVNLASRTLSFRWRQAQVPISAILRMLDEAGLEPRVLAHEDSAGRDRKEQRRAILRLGIATFCAMQVMMLAWPSYSGAAIDADIVPLLRWAQWLLATPGVLWAGWTFFANAARAIRARAPNMDVPVALALAVAYAASGIRVLTGSGDLYFDSATMFVWLLLIGRFLEARTRRIAGERLRLLAGRRALTARRRGETGIVTTVPITALAVGDEVIVAPGEALPADGTLLEAAAELDESLLTGESRPVPHQPGEALLAGSLAAGDSVIALRVTRTGADTTLAQITRLMNGAQQHKPVAQRIADRIAGHFVLAILLIAGATFAFTRHRGLDAALDVTLAVLVASCPCALSLALPIALAAASSRLASAGVLVADADALARLTRIDIVLFDKTGTLTRPELSLTRVVPLAEPSAERCLELAAALERDSRHPIATAFRAHPTALQAEQVRHIAAAGIEGVVAGTRYWLGAAERSPVPIAWPEAAAGSAAATWIVLANESRALAAFALEAVARPEAARTVRELSKLGLQVEVLSGDSAAATAKLAQSLGISRWAARQRPEEKLARLEALQRTGARVLAVGDGLNDAPLLAAAAVSAAMPQGAALTQAKADLVLVGDSLSGLPLVLRVARQAQRRVRENLAWALLYNAAVLPLAISGTLSPWMAAAGMSLSSLLVAGNALRLDPRDATGPTRWAKTAEVL